MPHTTALDLRLTISEIVARFPETVPVFNRFGMDTCCGGGVTVEEATRRHGIDLEPVLVELHAAVDHA